MVTTDADLFKINTRKILLQQKCKLRIHKRGWEVASVRTGSSLHRSKLNPSCPTEPQHKGILGVSGGCVCVHIPASVQIGELRPGAQSECLSIGPGTQAKRFLHYYKPHFYLNILAFFLFRKIKGLQLLAIAFSPI